MHRARRRILVIVARAAAPVVAVVVARIDNLQRDCGTAGDAIVVGVEAARGELVAATAGAAAVRLAGAV